LRLAAGVVATFHHHALIHNAHFDHGLLRLLLLNVISPSDFNRTGGGITLQFVKLLLLLVLIAWQSAIAAELAQGKSALECEAEIANAPSAGKQQNIMACILESSESALKTRCTQQQALVIATARADLKAGRTEAASHAMNECAPYVVDPKAKAFYEHVVAVAKQTAAKQAAKENAREAAERRKRGVHIGMSRDEVIRSSWGRPDHINRTTSAEGVQEQWVYGLRSYLYFKDGILTTIQN
jgi:hypothetical protein